jgi:transaldolase
MHKLKILGITDERIFETLRQRRDFEEESAMEEAKHISKIINNE